MFILQGRPKTPSPRHQPVNNKNCSLPVIMLRSERVDFQLSSAMYPRALVKAVSKIPVPSGTLLHNCHSHMYVKVSRISGVWEVEGRNSSFDKQSPAHNQNLSLLHYWNTICMRNIITKKYIIMCKILCNKFTVNIILFL